MAVPPGKRGRARAAGRVVGGGRRAVLPRRRGVEPAVPGRGVPGCGRADRRGAGTVRGGRVHHRVLRGHAFGTCAVRPRRRAGGLRVRLRHSRDGRRRGVHERRGVRRGDFRRVRPRGVRGSVGKAGRAGEGRHGVRLPQERVAGERADAAARGLCGAGRRPRGDPGGNGAQPRRTAGEAAAGIPVLRERVQAPAGAVRRCAHRARGAERVFGRRCAGVRKARRIRHQPGRGDRRGRAGTARTGPYRGTRRRGRLAGAGDPGAGILEKREGSACPIRPN